MSNRTSISVSEDTKDKAETLKRDDETWNEFHMRAYEALQQSESDSGLSPDEADLLDNLVEQQQKTIELQEKTIEKSREAREEIEQQRDLLVDVLEQIGSGTSSNAEQIASEIATQFDYAQVAGQTADEIERLLR